MIVDLRMSRAGFVGLILRAEYILVSLQILFDQVQWLMCIN